METTQATGPEQSQAQTPVHPIHEEQATLERLTKLVGGMKDNDPHEGTDMELPKEAEPEKKEEEPKKDESQEEPDKIELDEDAPIFEMPDMEDKTKSVKVSLKQLREERMMKADYMRNIQKVKAQEAELSTKAQQAALQAQQEYLQKLETHKQLVLKTVAPELQGVDLNKLAQEDPAEAQRIFFKQMQLNQTLQAIEVEQNTARQQHHQAVMAARQQAIAQARQTLEADIPGWSAETYNKVLGSVVSDYGFKKEEVEQVIDPRLVKVFHDASQYRQLQKAKPEVAKKVVAVPKVVKPGSAEKPNTSDSLQELRDRLAKTGRDEDFVALQLAKQKLQKRK